jgi:hypothetical protein
LPLVASSLLAPGAAAAGCSDDEDPLDSGGEYSVYDAIGELPESVEATFR